MRNEEINVHDFNNVTAIVTLRLDRDGVDKITDRFEKGEMPAESSDLRIFVQLGIEGVTLVFCGSQDMDHPLEKRKYLVEKLGINIVSYLTYLAKLEKELRATGYEGKFEVKVESLGSYLSYPPPGDEVEAYGLVLQNAMTPELGTVYGMKNETSNFLSTTKRMTVGDLIRELQSLLAELRVCL